MPLTGESVNPRNIKYSRGLTCSPRALGKWNRTAETLFFSVTTTETRFPEHGGFCQRMTYANSKCGGRAIKRHWDQRRRETANARFRHAARSTDSKGPIKEAPTEHDTSRGGFTRKRGTSIAQLQKRKREKERKSNTKHIVKDVINPFICVSDFLLRSS